MDYTRLVCLLLTVISLSTVYGGKRKKPGPGKCVGSKAPCNLGCPKGETCKYGKCCRMIIISRKCLSGKPGPSCSKTPCPDGYYCRTGTCCILRRTTSCPSGLWGPRCSEIKPCAEGYLCKRRRCCKDIGQSDCISGVKGQGCSDANPCKYGYSCKGGKCCRNVKVSTRTELCPPERLGLSCSREEKCQPGYKCKGRRCCRDVVPPSECPSGVVGPACSKSEYKPCKTGYSCIGGSCCRGPVCPGNKKSAGSCLLTVGMPRCAPGYECINDFCCEADLVPTPICPFGFTEHTCSKENQACPTGSTCKTPGKCCRDFPDLPRSRCPFFSPPRDPCPTPGPSPTCLVGTSKGCKRGRECCGVPCGGTFCV